MDSLLKAQLLIWLVYLAYDTSSVLGNETTEEYSWNYPWPEVLHDLSPYFNLLEFTELEIQGLLNMVKFREEDYLYNVTDYFPNGGWIATYLINSSMATMHLEETGDKSIYFCKPWMFNLGGVPHEIVCYEHSAESIRRDAARWYKMYSHEINPNIAIVAILMITGGFGNSLIIAVLILYKHMRNPTNILLGSLAISDLLVTLFIPGVRFYLRFWIQFLNPGEFMCNFMYYVEKVLFVNSVVHLIAISFERYFAICMPMKVKTICTMKRAKMLAPAMWIVSSIATLPSLFLLEYTQKSCQYKFSYYRTQMFTYHKAYQLTVFFCVPVILILHNYISIIIALIRSMRDNAALVEVPAQGSSRPDNEDIKKRLKVVKMLVAIVIIFVICWAPRIVWDFIFGLSVNSSGMNTLVIKYGQNNVTAVSQGLVFWSLFNSAANAPVYFFTSNQFNTAFKRALTCGKHGKDERITSLITQSTMASTSFTEKNKTAVNSIKT